MLKSLMGLSIVIFILMLLRNDVNEINFIELGDIIKNQKVSVVMGFTVLGLAALAVTTLYDLVLCKELGIDIGKIKTFKVSWIANTTNNFIGAGGVAAGGLRTAFYKKEDVSSEDSFKMTFVIWLTTLTGLSGLILINSKFAYTLNNKLFFILSLIIGLYIPFYLFIDKIPYIKNKCEGKIIPSVSIKIKMKMIAVAITEWLVAGLFFAMIIKYFVPEVTLSEGIGVFCLGITVSICSFIPAGIGSFDLTCIYGFKLLGISSPGILSGILFFRIFYYIIPWLLSMAALVVEFLHSKTLKKNKKNLAFLNEFGIKALGALTLFCGALLLVTSTVPMLLDRFKIVHQFLSTPILQFSQVTITGIGFILIILSKGIMDKVKSAYRATQVLLIVGAVLTLLKGFNIEEAIFLSLIAFLLYLAKDSFYREKSSMKIKTAILSFVTILFISLFYLAIYKVINNGQPLLGYNSLIEDFMYSPKAIFTYLFILFIIVFMIQFLSLKKLELKMPDNEDLEELKKFLEKYEGNSKTHLLFLKDKNFFYAMDKKVLIAFKTYDDKMIALGDPIGDKSLFKEGISEFRKFADKYHMTPVFYEINEENLPIYHENGFNFFKLGEEAFVQLEGFNLNGKKKADLRYIKNRIERGLFEFEMLYPPFDKEILEKTKEISDKWLGDRKEKGYSLGWFNEEYINLAPLGIVKYEGEIIAFGTIMPNYDNKTVGIDLMRLIPNPPNGTMDAVFYSFINWAKEQGYKEFNLGMAPLSNVGVNKFSKVKERMGRYVFNYGNKIYSFKGLRRYKEKFDPTWHGRYLAYPASSKLPSTLVDLAKLVAESPNSDK